MDLDLEGKLERESNGMEIAGFAWMYGRLVATAIGGIRPVKYVHQW